MVEIDLKYTEWKNKLEGYYQMIKDNAPQLPSKEFIDEASKWYSRLNEEEKAMWNEVQNYYKQHKGKPHVVGWGGRPHR